MKIHDSEKKMDLVCHNEVLSQMKMVNIDSFADMDNHTDGAQSVDTATDTTNSTYTQPGPTYTDTSTKDAYTDSTTKVTDTTVLDTTIPSEKTNFTDTADSSDGQGILHKFRHDAEFRHRFMHTAFVWWGFVTLVRLK